MRVLWVYDALSAHQAELAACLAKREGMSLDVICRWHGQPPLDRSAVPLTNLTCKSKLDFAARRAIRTRLRSSRYDVVHAYTSRSLANVLGACRGIRPQPKIIGYRGTTGRLHATDPANWITFWHPRLARTVCVCHAAKLALQNSGIDSSKLETVWEGCSLDSSQALPRSALGEFGIPEDAFVVGLVANMRPVKGVDVLLQAAVRLADLANVYWLLIGEVRDPRIHELASDRRIANRVRLPGIREHGGRYASLFDVYASPSRMEGMPMSIMEAMNQGACPITTAVGGCAELVRDLQDGLVVKPGSSGALADAIRFLHDFPDHRVRFVESARLRVTTVFTIEAWASRLHAVYSATTGLERRLAA